MKPSARHIVSATAIVFAAGCVTHHQSLATDVNPTAWSDAATITLSNTDTTILRDVSFFLNCNDRFHEDTLTVRISIRTPDRGYFEEPFRLVVPRTTTPAALTREAVIPYRRHVRFPVRGDYRLSITPCRTVRGIEAVGINLVKATDRHGQR